MHQIIKHRFMKKVVTLAIAALIATAGFAQASDTTSFLSNKNIPNVKLIQGDSTWFTNANIPKDKPVVVIYFSPECGHCQLSAQEINNDIDKVKDAFFIWVSYYPVPEIKEFADKYKLAQYDNFKFGRDPKYAIPTFYRVKFTPFMAVYNKEGKLMQTFDQGTTPEVLHGLIAKSLAEKPGKSAVKPVKKQKITS